jgi:DNA repair protein RecN (Recombination protein N)
VLEDVRIRGLGVIDDVALTLGPGLTVVTGETGAGKTMVVTALTLLFGARADAERVRSGAAQASVEATLLVQRTGGAAARAQAAGAELEQLADTQQAALTLRRVIAAGGRSRAFVGGAAAPAGVLGDIAEHVFALHGQSDQLRLTRPGEQLAALDRYAGIDRAPLQVAYTAWREAADAYDQRVSRSRELEREADLLRHGLAEVESIAPQPGEDAELSARVRRLSAADELRVAAREAHDGLVGDADDPQPESADARTLLARAAHALAAVAPDDDRLAVLGARVVDLVAGVDDIAADLRGYGDDLAADPQTLSFALDRQSQLRTLTRRYGEDLTAVLAWAAEAKARLEAIDTSDAAIEALHGERARAAGELAGLALAVSARRHDAAARLACAITTEIRELAMPTAAIEVPVSPRSFAGVALEIDGAAVPITPEGIDSVELLLRAHAGSPAVSLQRGASGGELSRVMLAVEVVLASTDPVPTMVFDEVDAGVGGRAAIEVGRRLARLARDRQVIVVTHLAQVAAFADAHLVIDKRPDDATGATEPGAGVTRSDVRLVAGAARRAELARMLSGQDTATARRHAGELLAAAQADRATPVGQSGPI